MDENVVNGNNSVGENGLVPQEPVEGSSIELPVLTNENVSQNNDVPSFDFPVPADANTEVTQNNEFSSLDNSVIEGFSSINLDSTDNNLSQTQPEFATADVAVEPVAQENSVKSKKKVNKTLIVVLIFVLVFGGAMLLMNTGNKASSNNNGPKEEEKKEIKVNTGTEWGNKYLVYMLEKKPELKTYEISFIDVNNDSVPEMFLKYIDNSDKESLKILYIAKDGYVYETKYYRDYRLRYIYSLKDKTTNWYLYLTTTKHYGSYTMISKIIDDMAFDADIKATSDSLLIEYGKKYYDTDYQPLFYTIKNNSHEDDFRDFVSKFGGYNKEVSELKKEVEKKYKDYVYVEDVKEAKDSVGIAGRIYKFGSYFSHVPADDRTGKPAYTMVLVLYEDNKVSVDGILYEYTVNYERGYLEFGDNFMLTLLSSGEFDYGGRIFKHSSMQ